MVLGSSLDGFLALVKSSNRLVFGYAVIINNTISRPVFHSAGNCNVFDRTLRPAIIGWNGHTETVYPDYLRCA